MSSTTARVCPVVTPSRNFSILLGLFITFALASTGCRTTADNQIDLLERELRAQENYIYELEDYIVEYSDKLRDCRSCYPSQTANYTESVKQPEAAEPPVEKTRKQQRSQQEKSVVEPQDELPAPADPAITPEISPEELEVPDDIDLQMDEPVSDYEASRPTGTRLSANPLRRGTRISIPDPIEFEQNLSEHPLEQILEEVSLGEEPTFEDMFADEQVEETVAQSEHAPTRTPESLHIAQLFHGDGERPDSLLAVVEALDANREPVDFNGEVSLMVMTTETDKPQRVKRWNFTAEELTTAWQSTDLGDGLHLELPLDAAELPATPLELWVRLVTSDGEKLLTQLPFDAGGLTALNSAPQPIPSESQPKESSLAMAKPLTSQSLESVESASSQQFETTKLSPETGQSLVDSPNNKQQPRWRASMQRADHSSVGFASSSSPTSGWTTQAPGRLPTMPPRVASRKLPQLGPTTSDSGSGWNTGSSVRPVTSQTYKR